ncbi:hypothetical protein B0H14DRAFT_2556989 [Mycena olivaceomarginata]|nr:hypothetical protein B0H14DRAFT_2556989 [Mycena olivaceomarginata]
MRLPRGFLEALSSVSALSLLLPLCLDLPTIQSLGRTTCKKLDSLGKPLWRSEHSPPPPDLDTGETWDLDFGNELPDLDCEDPAAGDLEPEMDDEVVEAPEISEENELKKFATLLSDAQEAARIQERELQKSSKRPKHYNRKSTTTLYRQRKAAKDLKQKGFLNVLDYIKG